MISFRSLSLPMLSLVAVLAGCSADPGTASGAGSVGTSKTDVVAESSTATNADSPKPGPGFHHGPPGGPDFLIGAALREPINLTADQRSTIEGLQSAQRPEHPAFDAAKAKELGAAIRAGNVSALQPPVFDATKMQAHLAASAKSLQTLHDTLSPTQRTALVETISAHADHGPKDGPKDGFKGRPGANGPHGGPDHFGGPMTEGLNLTDAQKEQLKSRVEASRPARPTTEQLATMKTNMDQMRTEMKAKLETFKGDNFDATAFVTPSKAFTPPKPDAHVNPLAGLVSVLTPAQRETLAQKIEAGPPATMHK